MKKILTIIAILFCMSGVAQESTWNVIDNQNMILNYNLLGKHYAQGILLGAGGYGLGMWLSGNDTRWGIVGGVLATNLPIILENKLNQPESVIGQNLGMITVAIPFTIHIEYKRKGVLSFELPPYLKKHK